jgi:hypothetical protein
MSGLPGAGRIHSRLAAAVADSTGETEIRCFSFVIM